MVAMLVDGYLLEEVVSFEAGVVSGV